MAVYRVVTPFQVTRPLTPQELADIKSSGTKSVSPVMVSGKFYFESFEEVLGRGAEDFAAAADQAEKWLRREIAKVTMDDPVGLMVIQEQRTVTLYPPYFEGSPLDDTHRVMSGDDFQVKISFTGGCTLKFTTRSQIAIINASAIRYSLPDLAGAVTALAEGALISTCLWGSEPGGFFLDFSKTPSAGCALVIHDMVHPDWIGSSPEDPWNAKRGAVRFSTNCDPDLFFAAFLRALTDSDGTVTQRDRIAPDIARATLVLASQAGSSPPSHDLS